MLKCFCISLSAPIFHTRIEQNSCSGVLNVSERFLSARVLSLTEFFLFTSVQLFFVFVFVFSHFRYFTRVKAFEKTQEGKRTSHLAEIKQSLQLTLDVHLCSNGLKIPMVFCILDHWGDCRHSFI